MSVMAMEIRSAMLGKEDAEMLSSMGMMGMAKVLRGKYEEAEAMHRQELAICEKVLGREHADTLTSVHCLAHLLSTSHRYSEYLALDKKACAGDETTLGKEHPTTRGCRQHYASALASEQ